MSGQIVRNNFKNSPQTSSTIMNNNQYKYQNQNQKTQSTGFNPQKTGHLSNNSNKINLQNEQRATQQNQKLEKYQNFQNNMTKQNSQKNIRDFYKKKQFISMEETLGFLNFINTHENQAFKMENIPQDQIQIPNKTTSNTKRQTQLTRRKNQFLNPSSSGQKSLIKKSSSGQLDLLDEQFDQQDDISQNKKKLNKNRAIKRIIQTAFGILQKNYRFGSHQLQFSQDQKSTSTQFNIYLKQYNRIMQQINSKQTQQIQKANILQQKNEEQLQQVFEYTVMQDFRQKLNVLFTKQKISKSNVQKIIPAFRQGLVILKLNEMRIQFPQNAQEAPKIIKMTQVQNVQYFTQPYIFIVLTITRDKTKSKEHLYLRFKSQDNQDKWDRALYCCFMSRKMNKKQRLFQIEFPVEDVMKKQKQEFIKNQEQYDVENRNGVIQRCFNENQPYDYSKKATMKSDQLENNLLSDRTQYLNPLIKRNMTQQKFTISILNAQSTPEELKRTNSNMNKKNSKNQIPIKSSKNLGEPTSYKKGTQDTNGKGQINEGNKDNQMLDDNFQIKRQNTFNGQPYSEESGNLSKKSTFNANNDNFQSPSTKNNSPLNNNTSSQNNQNPFMKLMKIVQAQRKKQDQMQRQQHSSFNESQSPENLERLKKLRRIREIQKNNIRGIIGQKQKFFMNKQKIVYFFDQSMINSSRSIPGITQRQQRQMQEIQKIAKGQIQKTKYLQYWDYDYKKDSKQQKKLICVNKIQSFNVVDTLGSNSSSLVINYLVDNGNNKVDKKQLRLLFAGLIDKKSQNTGPVNKAYQIYEWIQLAKEI